MKMMCGRCGHRVFEDERGWFSRHTVNDPDIGRYLESEEHRLCEDSCPHGPILPVKR